MAYDPSAPEEQGAIVQETHEADLPRVRKVDEEVGAETSREPDNAPKEAIGV